MKTPISTFIICSVLLFSACTHTSTSDDCTKVMCTADFRMITVTLKDSAGNFYIPDQVRTELSQNGAVIQTSSSPAIPGQNAYTVADDGNIHNITRFQNTSVIFKVIKNNVTVKQANYEIKADCCHIEKISGDDVMIIN